METGLERCKELTSALRLSQLEGERRCRHLSQTCCSLTKALVSSHRLPGRRQEAAEAEVHDSDGRACLQDSGASRAKSHGSHERGRSRGKGGRTSSRGRTAAKGKGATSRTKPAASRTQHVGESRHSPDALTSLPPAYYQQLTRLNRLRTKLAQTCRADAAEVAFVASVATRAPAADPAYLQCLAASSTQLDTPMEQLEATHKEGSGGAWEQAGKLRTAVASESAHLPELERLRSLRVKMSRAEVFEQWYRLERLLHAMNHLEQCEKQQNHREQVSLGSTDVSGKVLSQAKRDLEAGTGLLRADTTAAALERAIARLGISNYATVEGVRDLHHTSKHPQSPGAPLAQALAAPTATLGQLSEDLSKELVPLVVQDLDKCSHLAEMGHSSTATWEPSLMMARALCAILDGKGRPSMSWVIKDRDAWP
ncbi:unnamed protein product [Chrysoparadoxa australica]